MRFLVFVTIVLGFNSCKEDCDPGNLDQTERAWLMYSSGERVIFFSPQLQQYDTSYATSPLLEFVAGGYSQGQDDCGPHGTEQGSQSLSFVSGNQVVNIGVYHDYNRIGTNATINTHSIPEQSSGTVVINGHSYADVRLIQLDSSICVDQYIWRYYINQTNGVLKFDRKNGPSWELVQ